MNSYNLHDTSNILKGPTKEQIVFNNQWAIVALDKFHKDSNVKLKIINDTKEEEIYLKWDSGFSTAAMKEKIDMSHFGGVALAFFVMSVLFDYKYVEQSEIGTGVDYRFKIDEPDDDDLNFLDDFHYVEISGILEESKTNTLIKRIKDKHDQISKGEKKYKTSYNSSSVIVTLFSEPITVRELH